MYERSLFAPPRGLEGEADRWRLAEEVVSSSPLATLVSPSREALGGMEINHAPLILDTSRRELLGHFAGPNPHSEIVRRCGDVCVVFQTADSYVSPNWMAVPDVPTWNYASAQFTGRFEPAETYEEAHTILVKLSETMESKFNRNHRWEFHIPDRDPVATLTKGIQAFRIQIDSLRIKVKMSQNKSQADLQSIIENLEVRAPETARWMKSMKSSLK